VPSPGGPASDGSSGTTTGTSSTAFDFSRDDIGNAMRLAARLGTDGRFVPGWSAWALYQSATGLWTVDESAGGIRREAMAVVRQMEREAGYIEDPKTQSAFLAHIRSSGNLARLKAMIELAAGLRGMEAPAERFDADPTLLVCAGQALVLTESGVEVRSVRHADYATFSTGVPYSPDAHHPDWEKFLDRVLPDEHTRRWIQTLVGYSLQGGNPERVLVIAKGETTSGKSTFAEALRAALGRYAGPFNLSLFRERQDEGPRADIVGSLARRMLFASEASAEWTLHADSVKRFTGGDPVQARRLNSNALIERVPAFTPWLVTNSYPQIPGADLALWRRLKAAPFGASIPEAEVDLGVRVRVLSPEGGRARVGSSRLGPLLSGRARGPVPRSRRDAGGSPGRDERTGPLYLPDLRARAGVRRPGGQALRGVSKLGDDARGRAPRAHNDGLRAGPLRQGFLQGSARGRSRKSVVAAGRRGGPELENVTPGNWGRQLG
jgi:P4 family phage/plasmid primase-like protien